jgi:hypothetical protein
MFLGDVESTHACLAMMREGDRPNHLDETNDLQGGGGAVQPGERRFGSFFSQVIQEFEACP